MTEGNASISRTKEVDAMPSRTLLVHPDATERVIAEFDRYRKAHPESGTSVEVVRDHRVLITLHTAKMFTRLVISDPDIATIGNRVQLHGVSGEGELVVSTKDVILLALRHIALSGGYQKAGTQNSTPGAVCRVIQLPSLEWDGHLPFDQEAHLDVGPAQHFLTMLKPTNTYQVKLKSLNAQTFVALDDVGTLASGAALYISNKKAVAARVAFEPAPVRPSEWLGPAGWRISEVGVVVYDYASDTVDSYGMVRHMVTLKTYDGDFVAFWTSEINVSVGTVAKVTGYIRYREEHNGRKTNVIADAEYEPEAKTYV